MPAHCVRGYGVVNEHKGPLVGRLVQGAETLLKRGTAFEKFESMERD